MPRYFNRYAAAGDVQQALYTLLLNVGITIMAYEYAAGFVYLNDYAPIEDAEVLGELFHFDLILCSLTGLRFVLVESDIHFVIIAK